MEIIPLLTVIAVCQGPLHCEGVTFFLRDEPVVTTNSSSCLAITDIGDSVQGALVCQSSLPHGQNLTSGNWYLSSDGGHANSTAEGDRVAREDPRGWASDVVTNGSDGHLLVRLWRVSESAVEGSFTCNIPGDTYSPRRLYIFSSSTAVIPTNVRAKAVNATNMTVIWDDAKWLWLTCGGLAGFRVEWTAVSGGEVLYQDQTGDLSEAHLTGLTPFTSYSIRVAAVDKVDQVVGTYSQPLTIKTNEDTPGPVEIVLISSLVQIAITWSKPARPNGIITGYEVLYGPKNSSRLSSANTSLLTNFSVRVKLGAEFTFTVRAFTRAGAGEPTTVAVSTLTKPPVVEDVVVISLNDYSANVSWRALDVPFLPVSYTVVYSPVSQPPMEETAVVFPPPATSGVITGLVALTTYQIQVFATVTVDGMEIVGEKSDLVYFVNELSPSSQANPPSLSIVAISLTVVVVFCGIAVLAILVMLFYRKKTKKRVSYCVTSTFEEQHYVLSKGRQSDLLKHLWEQLDNKSMIYSTHQLRLSTALGHGVTGQVYKAYIKAGVGSELVAVRTANGIKLIE
jgi:hypothetical protein